MSQDVLLNIDRNIATITLNRPNHMNAFSGAMITQLSELSKEVADNPGIRAVILTSNGTVFSAGGDISFFQKELVEGDKPASDVAVLIDQINSVSLTFQKMDKPIISAVRGAVAGVAVSLMLATDLAIASEGTKFCTAYSKIGVSGDGGCSYFLPRTLGKMKAMELMLMADQISTEQALELGLINRIVDEDSLIPTAQSLAKHLANGPSKAFAKIKRLVNTSLEHSLEQHLDAERDAFVECVMTSDFKRAVSGFMEKKAIQFEGN